MKLKLKLKLGLVVAASLALVACSDTNQPAGNESSSVASSEMTATSSAVETVAVSINVQEAGEDLPDANKEIKAEAGETLLEAMEKNYDITEKEGFISAVEGHEQDDKAGKYWLYTVNGEQAAVGAADYILEDGDTIVWNLDGM
ncbi:DUF4430 domain-containing protein [Carnobacterium antarcticum]|uniref:DUF4430 domain-containing protein n=1 Tax=Carnobacterium antarcticum TaxID=2126436 RepID=A0ABW4NJN8_9LACT|nr:DUF4430 domain-containing protein [Carnobacterium sp. CP1]ALV21750.1 Additional lipoprotein component of predicted cobalamin ECF transporter [Carnobacterium sp. CP1]